MDLSLQQITYLITVAEQQSFGKAAKLCYVTQPTLSMQVKKAEEVLGFSFFNRDRKSD
jgi:LysR family transcriptional regulator, hydrogen peroxide-inducible genes activator